VENKSCCIVTQLVVVCFKIRPSNRNRCMHQTENTFMKIVGKDVIIVTKNMISKQTQ